MIDLWIHWSPSKKEAYLWSNKPKPYFPMHKCLIMMSQSCFVTTIFSSSGLSFCWTEAIHFLEYKRTSLHSVAVYNAFLSVKDEVEIYVSLMVLFSQNTVALLYLFALYVLLFEKNCMFFIHLHKWFECTLIFFFLKKDLIVW